MCTTVFSRSVLIRIAAVAGLLLSAAGCPSSGGGSGDADTGSRDAVARTTGTEPAAEPSAAAEQPPAPPVVEPPPPDAEPGLLPDVSAAEPLARPSLPGQQPPAPTVKPVRQTVGNTGERPNPLRKGSDPPGHRSGPLRNWGESPTVEPPPPTDPPAVGASDAGEKRRPGQHTDEPYDPIKENGPIFVGWPRPRLALVITGRQEGYLEPCGCVGLDHMKGGMTRRHTFLKYLRAKEGEPVAGKLRGKGWTVVAVDAGGLAKGYGRQAELKFHTSVEAMRKMGYDAIGLGMTDLRLPTGELFAVAATLEGQHSPFLSANVGLIGSPGEYTAQTRVIQAAGMKLGITSVLGRQLQEQIINDEIVMADPQSALAKVVPALKQQTDYLILLAYATMEESNELGRTFPDFDLVVTAGGPPEPPATVARVEGGKALLVEVGEKGMYAIVLGMFDDPKQPLRYQRVPLDSRFPASREMKALMAVYQDQLKNEWFSTFAKGKIAHPQAEIGGKFVGSKKCQSCHEASYDIWKKGGHAKAYRTLVELDPPRNFDPECVSCHVIGWHPTDHYPYKGGFRSPEDTPELIDVGCESCHGPGEAHVAAEMDGDLALQKKLQQALVITKAEATDPRSGKAHCYSCHDGDNSPDFDFETYWPLVEHYEE